MGMITTEKKVAGPTPARRRYALLYGMLLILGIVNSMPASSADPPAKEFTRIAWLSNCEPSGSVTYFYLDLLPQGVVRYEGVTDVKTLGSKEGRLDSQAVKQLHSAVRDFLAGKARTSKGVPGPNFCIQVQVYKAGRVVDAQSELIYANQPPAVLQKINESASPRKWACPARLSSTKSGSKSARYCDWPAFTLTVVGRTVCDPSRHVEVYLDGSVYIATRISRGDRLVDHSYYQIEPTTVAKLVDTINTFEAISTRAFEDSARPTYRRSRPEDIEDLKRRLSELIGVKLTSAEGAECDEPSTATEEVSLHRDLDRAVKAEDQQP